ncbi:hypothetical protein Ahy_A03g013823 [Arachis hypogaea]|uniref:Uncharacterized protein n=1 Tax=Arachis hypogaea TaxID=3818 RepID=A0A445DW98_ARAHY|nr:hypothetical protein Ahy_A03g013823 [Arachis hypogaea]
MASEDSFLVLVHYKGSIQKKIRSRIKFTDKDPLILRDDVKYDSFIIGSDEDLEFLFHCHYQIPEVKTLEMLAKFVDVVSSSGGLNWNPQAPAMAAYSNSRPSGASSSLHVIVAKATLFVSPSFPADLNCSGDRELVLYSEAQVSLDAPPELRRENYRASK